MTENIISIERKRRHRGDYVGACEHNRLALDDRDQVVECLDCGKQLSAWWVLEQVVRHQERDAEIRRARWAEIEEARQHTLHLKAAREVERIWRGRKMVPCCPHCGQGIMPEDRLGDRRINREIELARRNASKPDAGGEDA